jgi:hypothetical protein
MVIPGIGNPAIGLKQYSRAVIFLAIPPIARATGATAHAQNAFPQAI